MVAAGGAAEAYPMTENGTLADIRAEALFASDLQPSQHPAPEEVRASMATTLRRHSRRWCAARMAEEYGEHPDTAIVRMAWAVRTISDCYPAERAAAFRSETPERSIAKLLDELCCALAV